METKTEVEAEVEFNFETAFPMVENLIEFSPVGVLTKKICVFTADESLLRFETQTTWLVLSFSSPLSMVSPYSALCPLWVY